MGGVADRRHILGLAAEAAVASWLEGHRWRVLATRVRAAAGGEVDLIALDPTGVLVAIEVRSRRSDRAGSAAMSVDRRRVARLGRTLAAYAAAGRTAHRGLRIDLVCVEPSAEAAGRWRLRRLAGIG